MWQGIYFQKMESLIQLRNEIVLKKLSFRFPIYTFKDLKIHVHVLLFHNINVFYTTNTWLYVEKNLKNLKCDINFDNKTLFDLNNFKICYQKN